MQRGRSVWRFGLLSFFGKPFPEAIDSALMLEVDNNRISGRTKRAISSVKSVRSIDGSFAILLVEVE